MAALRFGIVGFAHIHAWSYARVLRELEAEGLARLVAICDDDASRLERAKRETGCRNAYASYEDMLRKEELDAVIVTTENARHVGPVLLALERGVHVLCEKPIATTLEDADRMVAAVRRSGLKFQTAFVMRYHSATVELKRMLEEGAVGRIVAINSTNHGKYPDLWFGDPELAGGGCVMDHTVHNADLMRWYTGDEVAEVYAVRGRNIRGYLKVEDNALISLRFRRGVFASIDCSWSRPDSWPIWGDVYMAVFGTEGYIVVDAFRSYILYAPMEGTPESIYFGCDCDYEMIRDFVRVIREDGEPRATVEDGRQALAIALAAYESIRRGEPVSPR